MKEILAVDVNAPWVRSFFAAMTDRSGVRAFHADIGLAAASAASRAFTWSAESDGVSVRHLLLPGWTRFGTLTNSLVIRAIRRALRRFPTIDAIAYTLPFYAGAAAAFHGQITQAYYAHDVFRFYQWDRPRIAALESQMLESCDAVFCVAEALSEDFRRQTETPVITSRMAVSQSFIEAMDLHPPRPAELQNLAGPLIGCIGQINHSYDVELIERLCDGVAEATFVFIGPLFDEAPQIKSRLERALHRPNVRWLGPRPHRELPGYLHAFDICLNPLVVSEHNDRRSPLRLYDYLATDKPILSTAIREASSHQGLVEIAHNADEAVGILRRLLAEPRRVDVAARREYLTRNTWSARAGEFVAEMAKVARPRRT